ncbi:hypothetical protein BKA93DRAFT_751926 [Sparassis latifolia]
MYPILHLNDSDASPYDPNVLALAATMKFHKRYRSKRHKWLLKVSVSDFVNKVVSEVKFDEAFTSIPTIVRAAKSAVRTCVPMRARDVDKWGLRASARTANGKGGEGTEEPVPRGNFELRAGTTASSSALNYNSQNANAYVHVARPPSRSSSPPPRAGLVPPRCKLVGLHLAYFNGG